MEEAGAGMFGHGWWSPERNFVKTKLPHVIRFVCTAALACVLLIAQCRRRRHHPRVGTPTWPDAVTLNKRYFEARRLHRLLDFFKRKVFFLNS